MSIAAQQRKAAFCRPKHSTNDLDTLLTHAQMAQNPLLAFATALAQELHIEPSTHVIKGPLKLRERADDKAAKYKGNFNEIPDLVRDRVLFDEIGQVIAFRSMMKPGKANSRFLQEWEKRGIRIVDVDDAFLSRKKSGYVGINVSVEIDLGKGRWHTGEIQLMHEGMQGVYEDTKYNYDHHIRPVTDIAFAEGRDLTAEESARIAPFQQANKDMYNGAIVQNRLAGLLSKAAFDGLIQDIQDQKASHLRPVSAPGWAFAA
jgi:hypothetical protein